MADCPNTGLTQLVTPTTTATSSSIYTTSIQQWSIYSTVVLMQDSAKRAIELHFPTSNELYIVPWLGNCWEAHDGMNYKFVRYRGMEFDLISWSQGFIE